VGSVTAEERFVETWENRRYSSFELVSDAPCTPPPPPRGRRCVASKTPNVIFGLDLLLGPNNRPPRSLTGPEQLTCNMFEFVLIFGLDSVFGTHI